MNKIKILDKLEEILGEGVINGEEVDITARKVYDLFINPILLHNELLKSEIRELNEKLTV